MTFITLDRDTSGWQNLPGDLTVLGRDDLGDLLAMDARGTVWSIPHDLGPSPQRSKAFRSLEALEMYVAVQADLEVPHGEQLDALDLRLARLENFRRSMGGSPYAQEALRTTIAEVREQIAERRFERSRRGRSLAERQALGKLCEAALRDAGAPGEWIVGALHNRPRDLMVQGPLDLDWSEDRVRKILEPLIGPAFRLVFFATP